MKSNFVQAGSKRAGQVTRPDYALFADDAACDQAYAFQGDDDAFYRSRGGWRLW